MMSSVRVSYWSCEHFKRCHVYILPWFELVDYSLMPLALAVDEL